MIFKNSSLGRSSGRGNDNPLQYFCLGNPMDRVTCQAAVHDLLVMIIYLENPERTNKKKEWMFIILISNFFFILRKKLSPYQFVIVFIFLCEDWIFSNAILSFFIVFCLKTDFIFLGLKITVDGECSHGIKATTNLVVVIQSLNCVQFFLIPWTAGCQDSLSFIISRSLLKLTSIELVLPSNHLTLFNLLLIFPSVFPIIRVFSSESAHLIRWSKYCSFKFSIRPSNEYLGLICFRIDWFDLPAIQGTLKCLNQAP